MANNSNNTATLAQVARQAEQDGQSVKTGSFDSFESFISYFNQHYKPMLERWQGNSGERLMNFFIDDMLEAFSEGEEE